MIKTYLRKETDVQEILIRTVASFGVDERVAAIIADVKARGDEALFDYCERFDGVRPASLEVSREEIDAAADAIDPAFYAVLCRAKENIEAFHRNQIRSGFVMTGENGVVMGQRVLPLDRVGIYVPGGTAAYPSSVLMNCLPAKLAGVKEVVMVTPPGKDGVPPAILAAAKLAGVDRVYRVGGAQAVAALAYGTETVVQVDKIVGPGNAYVAEAKRQVFGQVAIDMIAGPSEILIVADEKSNPCFVAADLLSQAEHDVRATAVLITDSAALAKAVTIELENQLAALPRESIARRSIDENGKIIVVDSIEEAIDLSNLLAPEHLELCLDSPFDYLDRVRHAGSVFLGRYCPEALGDYLAGPNHTLPTNGAARFSSPLSVDDFVKKSQFTYYTPAALGQVGRGVALFAEREGLSAHGKSVTVRLEENEK